MKTNIILLTFLLICSFSSNGAIQQIAATPAPVKACVVDEAGNPMIYVDIKDQAGKILVQTDVNGCFSLEGLQDQDQLQFYFPGYESLIIEGTANSTTYTMLEIKQLPPVYQPGKPAIYPTESRGDHILKGSVADKSGEPLIGASILIKGTSLGTVTDLDGTFTLLSPTACADLSISYTGFETIEKTAICTGKDHHFKLEAGLHLEEVVVTGATKKARRISARSAESPRMMTMMDAAAPPPPPPPPAPMMEPKSVIAHDAPPPPPSVIEEVPASTSSSKPAPGGSLPTAGQLTAGEVNDFSKWDMWADISQEDLGQYRNQWKQFADHRYTLQLTTPSGAAVVNAIATLEDGQGNALWQARTDAQGRAELWAHYFRDVATPANGLSILINYEGTKKRISSAKPFQEGINFETIRTDCRTDAVVDIAFVVDATGSMGDEISYLQAELLDVIQKVREGLPGVNLQMGSVFYRDKNEEYLTRVQPFTKDSETAVSFLKQQHAQGGGDYPEAVETALESALDSLQWRDQASTRLLYLVLDAPPHQAEENIKRLQVAITKAAQRGIQIIPVSCSGVDKNTEFLLRSMALATNGTYTFITDHSGIGNSHIEPSTDSYEVEYLNDVLTRLSIDRSKLASCATTPIAAIPDPIPDPATRDWTYYPNPTSGSLNLKFTEAPGILYLADAQGKLLLQRNAQDQFEMDLSTYPSGTYWLRHEAEDGTWTQGQLLLLAR